MLKRILLAAVAAGAIWLGGTETAALKQVPKKSEVVLSADFSALFRTPGVREALADSKKLQTWQQKNGFQLDDLEGCAFFYSETPAPGTGGALLTFRRTPPLEKLAELTELNCVKSEIGGIPVFTMSAPNQPTRVAAGLLNPNTVLISSTGWFAEAAKCCRSGATGFVYPKQLAGLLRFCYRPTLPAELSSVTGAFRLTGEKKRDLQLEANLKMVSAQNAAQLAQQLPIYVNLGIGMAFADDPELGAKVAKSIRIERREKSSQIRISAVLPEAVLKAIGKYSEAQARKQRELKNRPARPEEMAKPTASARSAKPAGSTTSVPGK